MEMYEHGDGRDVDGKNKATKIEDHGVGDGGKGGKGEEIASNEHADVEKTMTTAKARATMKGRRSSYRKSRWWGGGTPPSLPVHGWGCRRSRWRQQQGEP